MAAFRAPTPRVEGPAGTFWAARFPWWPVAHGEHLWGVLYLLRLASGQHECLALSSQHWGCPGDLGAAEGPRVPRELRTASLLGARRRPPPLLPSLSAPCRGRPLSGVTPRLQAAVGWGSGAPQSPERVHPVTPTPEQPQPPGRTPLLPAALGQWLEATFPFSGLSPRNQHGGQVGLSGGPEVTGACGWCPALIHAPAAPRTSACDLFGSRGGCVQTQLRSGLRGGQQERASSRRETTVGGAPSQWERTVGEHSHGREDNWGSTFTGGEDSQGSTLTW